MNLAFRWYIGYDLNEIIPDHSSLTRIRERYGVTTFRRFFEQIVQLQFAARSDIVAEFSILGASSTKLLERGNAL